MRLLRYSVAWGALLLAPSGLPAATLTTTQTLTAVISPEGGFFSLTSNVSLTKNGSIFTNFTSSPVAIQYCARTTQSTGGGNITVKATADFSPSGGPSIASPPSTGDGLTYTCSTATLGQACTNTPTVSTTTAMNVVAFAPSECSSSTCGSSNRNTVTVTFYLTDDPKYNTGSYSATLTFTISAT